MKDKSLDKQNGKWTAAAAAGYVAYLYDGIYTEKLTIQVSQAKCRISDWWIWIFRSRILISIPSI